jgi:hypothetical protein
MSHLNYNLHKSPCKNRKNSTKLMHGHLTIYFPEGKGRRCLFDLVNFFTRIIWFVQRSEYPW